MGNEASKCVFHPYPAGQPVDLLIIAGEHSGDEQAARMLRQARSLQPSLKVAAIGGEELARAGAHLLFNPLEHAVVGFVEVMRHFSYLKALFEQTIEWISTHRPRAVCFVDYPGFNLRMAKALYKRRVSTKGGGNVRLLFYISPQIWAWKSGRRFTMARHLDALATIFPFEVECYSDTTLPVEFVGHPFVAPDHELPLQYSEEGDLLLLPGSRSTPVKRIFPSMVQTYYRLRKRYPHLRASVMCATEKLQTQLEHIIEAQGGDARDFSLIPKSGTIQARAVIMSSGTISLVCALAAIPGILVYRTNPLSYVMARLLVKVSHIGIANLILGESIHPEYLQSAMKPARLEAAILPLIQQQHNVASLSETLRTKLETSSPNRAGAWLLEHLDA